MWRVFLFQLSVYALCSPIFWKASAEADLLSSDSSCACSGRRDSSLDQLEFDTSSLHVNDAVLNNKKHDDLGVQSESVLTATPGLGDNAGGAIEQTEVPVNATALTTISENMAFIDGGLFYMGTDNPSIHTDGEGPRRMVNLTDFMMDRLILISSLLLSITPAHLIILHRLLPLNIISHYFVRYEVSNEEYLAFFENTGYRSDSEVYGWSFVFDTAGAMKAQSGLLFVFLFSSVFYSFI